MNILEFINNLRNTDKTIQIIYMKGGCYKFSKLLIWMFGGISYKIKMDNSKKWNHVITKIDDLYYDINGVVELSNIKEIETVDNDDLEELERWSFYKNYFLGMECPYCEEIIIYEE